MQLSRREFVLGVMGAAALASVGLKTEPDYEEIGRRMAEALARSMGQTREHAALKVWATVDELKWQWVDYRAMYGTPV